MSAPLLASTCTVCGRVSMVGFGGFGRLRSGPGGSIRLRLIVLPHSLRAAETASNEHSRNLTSGKGFRNTLRESGHLHTPGEESPNQSSQWCGCIPDPDIRFAAAFAPVDRFQRVCSLKTAVSGIVSG